MKGLLRKDLYMIVKYCRTLLVICGIFLLVAAVAPGDNLFLLVYPVLLGGVLPVTLLSYDERFHWDATCDTMPISRRTVVSERYLMSLLSFLALYLLTLAVQAAVLLPRGYGAALGQIALVLPAMGLLPSSILLPVMFRFGVEKGRIVYFFVIGAFVAVFLIFTNNIVTLGSSAGAGGWAATLASIALFVLSWLLSIRLYEKREL